MLFSVEYRLFL